MSLNGSGVFVVNSTGQPVVATTLIEASVFNAFTADVATALSTALYKDGQQTPTANIPMGGNRMTGMGAGIVATDSANMSQLSNGAAVYVSTVGGTADVITLTPTPAITAYAAGQNFKWIASGANTTNVTVAVNGLAAKAVTKNGNTALVAGDIPSGSMVEITYDGTQFIIATTGAATVPTTALLKAGGTMTGDLTMSGASIIEAEGAAVVAASSTNIWATDGNTVHVTGNTGIADFATAPQAGAWMKVIFDGTPILTQSANLNLNAGGANITIAAGDVAFVYADTTTQMDVFVIRKSGAAVVPPTTALTSITNSLGADVACNNTANYFDGPSVAQGSSGTWFASGTVSLQSGAIEVFYVKLWDGTNVIASCLVTTITSNPTCVSLSGVSVSGPPGNLRISVRGTIRTDSLITFNSTGNSVDSTITAVKIA